MELGSFKPHYKMAFPSILILINFEADWLGQGLCGGYSLNQEFLAIFVSPNEVIFIKCKVNTVPGM